jgi:hypothetical protein
MKHRTDRYFEHEPSTLGASVKVPPRLVVVLCGSKADAADESGGHGVSTTEMLSFIERSGVSEAFVTSAKTGEGAEEAFQALLLASLEAEEEAEANRVAAEGAPKPGEMFSLTSPFALLAADGSRDLSAMSSPRGLRPHEPSRGSCAAPVVEVIDNHGRAYGARPLHTCLEMGLKHRVVHVWLTNPRSGGLLLRRCSHLTAKEPNLWGPSARGEVLCYQKGCLVLDEHAHETGPQSAELSFDTAVRVLREQLGFECASIGSLDHWGTCVNRQSTMHELIEIYAVDVGQSTLPDFQLRRDEEIEWVHFTDIFGSEGMDACSLFHISTAYQSAMVQKMRTRVEYAHSGHGLPNLGFAARGRPTAIA